jgi:hypothetical protein
MIRISEAKCGHKRQNKIRTQIRGKYIITDNEKMNINPITGLARAYSTTNCVTRKQISDS